MRTRYYSTQRPVAPGTYPKRGCQKIMNFDDRIHIDEIGKEAWGYIDYDRELTPQETSNYELIKGELI